MTDTASPAPALTPPSAAQLAAAATIKPTPEQVEAYDFESFLDEARAGLPPKVDFQFRGEWFSIPSPIDWSDELLDKQTKAQANPDTADLIALATEFLGGADEYARWCSVGGTAMHFNLGLPGLMRKATGGAAPGESAAS
jgi:hypothetical protein